MKKERNKKEPQLLSCNEKIFFEPGVDYIFKKVFGIEENKKILKGLICSILGMTSEEIDDITIVNGELPKQNRKDKLSRLDILLKLNNQKMINIEMQMFNYKTLSKRILYYWSQVYISTSQSGTNYDGLKPCITIWLLNQTMFKETEKAHTTFTIREKELDIQFSDVFEAHIVELTKTEKNNEKLNEWIKFLNLKSKEEMKMLRENTTNNEVKEAIDIVKLMTLDEKSRYEYINRVMEIKDYYTLKDEAMQDGIEEGRKEGIEEGRKEGIEKGRKEGIEEGKKEGIEEGRKEGIEKGKKEKITEVVKEMLKRGTDIAFISEITKLPEETIINIQKEIENQENIK